MTTQAGSAATHNLYTPRRRPPMSARRLTDEAAVLLKPMREYAGTAVAAPFTGITNSGPAARFPVRRTGVPTQPLTDAATAFLAALHAGRRQEALQPIESEQWQRWSNIHPFVMRHGVLLESLDEARRRAALDLLAAGFSAAGYRLARDIMRLNETIGEMTGSADEYGEWVYWLSIFGTPSETEPWGWQIDGHHLNVNCFVLGDQIVMTPAFMGSEPVVAPTGTFAGTSVLQSEERLGLELVRALAPAQQQKAIIEHQAVAGELPPGRARPERIRAGAFHDNLRLEPAGVPAAELSAGQQRLLLDLIETYTGRLRDGHSGLWLAELRQWLPQTHFAWIGGTEPDSVFYYRIQSPAVLIEFDHQSGIAFDNPEPTRTHIHTIVRTPNGNDYGKDLLRQHYEQHPHANAS